ncbi:calcium uptake protein, mitochondrial-like isoform X1 [Rhododendron vialii]|uniref:calcium uptake protein, mitochondrial-like isoform X1 n=1 Tax=Rhododendron vialii TaxID=182163 RepID=UPI00265DD7FD|nr:calcium uptake protein, mitochondrial-like isoform X1 [Rhododendron vialii]
MHYSRALLRPSWLLIRRGVSAQRPIRRPISTQSHGPSSSPRSSCGSTSYGENKSSGCTNLESVLKSVLSWAVVVGPGLGLCYWSSSVSDSSSFWALADSGGESMEPEKKPKFLFGDVYRRKVFFKYEKRMRMQSPPEKVFEYFASIQTPSGEVLMTPADLMRAIVPVFSPSESNRVREGFLKGELVPGELHCAPSDFFMLFDTNGDGLISFAEYIFFVTILSIPESGFSVAFKMFDLNNNGQIDKEEFKKVMALMRTYNRQGAHHRDGLRIGLNVTGSVENGGLLEYFFGKDGNECLEHEKFVQFLRDLHDEILRLEFAHYDYKSKGTISAKDFALSMVASADMSHINKFLDRVEELKDEPYLREVRITFEEFKNFAELRQRLRPLSMAIFSHGKVTGQLTKPDFQRAAYQVCGISLTDNVVDMIFYVFDTNRDGSLSTDEFLRVLQRRERGMSLPRETTGFMGFMSCLMDCTNNCSYSKMLH